MAVGDPDQCLVAGTLVTMADGSSRPIESVQVGDEVLSCYGGGVFAAAPVTRTQRFERRYGIAITTESGRRIGTSRTSTDARSKSLAGPSIRLNGEHADAAWVVAVHESEAEARLAETVL